jgi:hypothetical protein
VSCDLRKRSANDLVHNEARKESTRFKIKHYRNMLVGDLSKISCSSVLRSSQSRKSLARYRLLDLVNCMRNAGLRWFVWRLSKFSNLVIRPRACFSDLPCPHTCQPSHIR